MKKSIHSFWDENKTRYRWVHQNEGPPVNWLFFPGGPGCDSCYFLNLLDELKLPGNCWLIDFPNNGDNEVSPEYDFDEWYNCFLPAIARFKNPIYVGHSFSGMFPLLFPQLEG